jgi:hypothetical protein
MRTKDYGDPESTRLLKAISVGDKPAAVTESASVLGDSFFDRLLSQQLSRKSDLRDRSRVSRSTRLSDTTRMRLN